MDELHYVILKPNTDCWVLIASIDNPYIYIPTKCHIVHVTKINSLRYRYSLRPLDFIDSFKDVNRFFNGNMYRTFNYEKNRISDFTISLDTSLCSTPKDIANLYNTNHSDELLVSLAPMVFETKDDCLKHLRKFEISLAEEFTKTLKYFSKRQKQYKLK